MRGSLELGQRVEAQPGKPRVGLGPAERKPKAEWIPTRGRRGELTVAGLKGWGEEFRLYSMMNWTPINSSLAPQSRHLEIES